MRFKYSALPIALLSAASLSGCGSDEETINHASLSITAVDGYIQQALLCSDINEDGQCSENEIVKSYNDKYILTNNGFLNTTISLKTEELLTKHTRLITTIQSFDKSAPVLTTDKDLPNLVMKPVTLRAPASANVISPITDLISAKMQSGASLEEAEESVISLLSAFSTPDVKLDKTTLYIDYVLAKTDIEKANLKTDLSSNEEYLLLAKLHKLAQVMTETKAMASSIVAFDKFLDDVVQSSQELVSNLDLNALLDPSIRPYIPVTENGVEPAIKNQIAQFNVANMQTLANEFKALADLHGDIALWQDVEVAIGHSLISDPDVTNNIQTLSVTNASELAKSNLKATITETLISVSRIDVNRDVTGKNHQIILGTNDLDSAGNPVIDHKGTPVVIASSLPLELTVSNINYAPDINVENQTLIQAQIDKLVLEQGITINNLVLSLDSLFSDKNNDPITYSATSTLPGLAVKVEGTDLFILGTPHSVLNNAVLEVTASDGNLSEKVSFTLPDVTPIHENALRDKLLESNSRWYRWNTGNDDAQAVVNNRANCMAFSFTIDENLNKGTVQFAEGATCPDETFVDPLQGTWTVDANGQFTINLGDEPLLLSGVNDHTQDEYLPRIRTYEVTTQVVALNNQQQAFSLKTQNNGRGVTFFDGQVSAETYWNNGYGFAYIDNDERTIDASVRHGQFTEFETGDYLDVDLTVKYRTCEQMGFEPDPENVANGGYRPSEMIRASFNLFGEGFNGQPYRVNPYAFKGSNANGTYCDINLDIRQNDPLPSGSALKSGQVLTIHYSPKDNNTDEEFIINTFIDRDVDILPQVNLNIASQDIYLVDGYSVLKLFVDTNGDIKKTTSTYDGVQWSNETTSPEQLITQYTAENGNFAYQIWNVDVVSGKSESFTLWSDANGSVKVKGAGKKEAVTMDSYIAESEATNSVESTYHTKVILNNTTWKNTFIVEATMTFTETHITYKKQADAGEVYDSRADLPISFPVCMKDESCIVGNFPVVIQYCKDTDVPSWDGCSNNQKYTATWTYQNNNGNEVLTEKTIRYANGDKEHRDWVKQ